MSSRTLAYDSVASDGIGVVSVLAPGVGWAANAVGFYLTHDSSRRWTQATVPGLSGEDVTGDLTSTASPSPRDIALAFTDGAAARTCTPPATAAIGAGAVATTSDAGRSWHTEILPGCVLATSLSFISSKVGFALAGPGWGVSSTHTNGRAYGVGALYRTTDGGHSWREASICHGTTVLCQSPTFFGRDGVVAATEEVRAGGRRSTS